MSKIKTFRVTRYLKEVTHVQAETKEQAKEKLAQEGGSWDTHSCKETVVEEK